MQIADGTHSVISALALGAALCLTPALTLAKDGLDGAAPLRAVSSTAGLASVATTLYTLDVTGILSVGEEGDPENEVRELQIGAGSKVVGIGWEVTLFARSPSWLSEMQVSFGSSSETWLYLPPSLTEEPGTASYSSSGVVDLSDVEGDDLRFDVGADGKLRMEFYEFFDDFSGDIGNNWDGIWQSGTLTLEVAAIPEPSTYGLMALGLLAVGAAARRRCG